ncbi:hypothetical protein V7114_06925 [Neobacillus niacini]|uniref:hypothetical protein n=1 Tax=Neobacillus niacini TaxID=86668 RepID=UPI002FFF47B4
MNNLNNLISEFQSERSDQSFEIIYAEVTQAVIGSKDGNPYFRQIARSMKADAHDVKAVFDDTLLSTLANFQQGSGYDFINYFKASWRRRRANLYKKAKRIRDNEVYDDMLLDEELDESFARIPDLITVEDIVFKTKEADQRQLIDFLVRGENERTTAIVQTFLSHPKPNATAIAKEIGLDHKQVSRALNRLAGKFSTKKFGNYQDFLVAL